MLVELLHFYLNNHVWNENDTNEIFMIKRIKAQKHEWGFMSLNTFVFIIRIFYTFTFLYLWNNNHEIEMWNYKKLIMLNKFKNNQETNYC